jgi:hypothetical protein
MYISDGVLSNPVCIGGYVAALGMNYFGVVLEVATGFTTTA